MLFVFKSHKIPESVIVTRSENDLHLLSDACKSSHLYFKKHRKCYYFDDHDKVEANDLLSKSEVIPLRKFLDEEKLIESEKIVVNYNHLCPDEDSDRLHLIELLERADRLSNLSIYIDRMKELFPLCQLTDVVTTDLIELEIDDQKVTDRHLERFNSLEVLKIISENSEITDRSLKKPLKIFHHQGPINFTTLPSCLINLELICRPPNESISWNGQIPRNKVFDSISYLRSLQKFSTDYPFFDQTQFDDHPLDSLKLSFTERYNDCDFSLTKTDVIKELIIEHSCPYLNLDRITTESLTLTHVPLSDVINNNIKKLTIKIDEGDDVLFLRRFPNVTDLILKNVIPIFPENTILSSLDLELDEASSEVDLSNLKKVDKLKLSDSVVLK